MTKANKYEYLNTSNGRWIDVGDDNAVASVTTILNIVNKPFLTDWKIKQGYEAKLKLRQACDDGDVFHDIAERLKDGESIKLKSHYLIKGREIYITREMQKAIVSFVEWWNDDEQPIIPIASEVHLAHPEFKWGGTADAILKIWNKKEEKFETWLIDYKTSSQLSEHVDLQLTAYALLWNKLNPKNKVEKIGVLHCKKSWIRANTCAASLKEFKLNEKVWLGAVELFYHYNQKPRLISELPREFKLTKHKEK